MKRLVLNGRTLRSQVGLIRTSSTSPQEHRCEPQIRFEPFVLGFAHEWLRR